MRDLVAVIRWPTAGRKQGSTTSSRRQARYLGPVADLGHEALELLEVEAERIVTFVGNEPDHPLQLPDLVGFKRGS
eukprot:566483-Rhodomonas_salina.2